MADGAATYTPGISERRSSTTKHMHAGLKNADMQTNSSQTSTGTRRYDAFGLVVGGVGSYGGPFGYAGKFGYQSSEVSELMLLGHRYYVPSTGRFLTRDPIKDGRNWYAYGAGEESPTHFVDPDGQVVFVVVLFYGGMVLGGAAAVVWDQISNMGKGKPKPGKGVGRKGGGSGSSSGAGKAGPPKGGPKPKGGPTKQQLEQTAGDYIAEYRKEESIVSFLQSCGIRH